MLAVRRSAAGRASLAPDGSGDELLALRDGRTARLITRVDFRDETRRPVTVQSADERRDPRARAPASLMGRLLHEEGAPARAEDLRRRAELRVQERTQRRQARRRP